MVNYIKHPYKKLTFLQSTIFNEVTDEYFCPLNKLYYHKNNSGHSYAILLKIIEFLEKSDGKNIFVYCNLTEQATYLYHYICNSKLLRKHIAIYLVDRSINKIRFKPNIKKSIFIGRLRTMKGGKIEPDLIICDKYEKILSDRDNLTYLSKIFTENEKIQIYFFTAQFTPAIFCKLSFVNNLKRIIVEGKEYKTEHILCTYKSSKTTFFSKFNENILKENNKEEKGEVIREIRESPYHLTEYTFPVQSNSIPVFFCEILQSVFKINRKVVIFAPNFTLDFFNDLLLKNQHCFFEQKIASEKILQDNKFNFANCQLTGREELKIYRVEKKSAYEEKKYILEQFDKNMIDKTVLLCGSKEGMPFNCTFFSALNIFSQTDRCDFLNKELNKYKQLNLNKYDGIISSEFKTVKKDSTMSRDDSLIQEREGKYLFDLNFPSIINIPYRYKTDEQIVFDNKDIKVDSEVYMSIIKQMEKNRLK